MNLDFVPMPGAQACATALARHLGTRVTALESRRFPDGEIYLRVLGDVAGRHIAVVAQLRDPDPQLPGLLFLADALRDLGATGVGLVAPYLPYMRQDTRFRPGEAITSRSFARIVSAAFDWLATVDPHLHRVASLDALYAIRSAAVPSAPAIARWVQAEVAQPQIVGPDEESAQWVAEVARLAGCPFSVLRKQRRGDREVEIAWADTAALRGRTPVLVDDIVSSGQTLATAVRVLRAAGLAAPVCVGVHALFDPEAVANVLAAGAARVVSCNTLPHPSNAIDLTAALAQAIPGIAA